MLDIAESVSYGLVISLTQLALGSIIGWLGWKILRKRVKNFVYETATEYIYGLAKEIQKNPKQYAEIIKPVMMSLLNSGAPQSRGEAGLSLGPLNKFIPKWARGAVVGKLLEMFGVKAEGQEQSKPQADDNPFK